MFPIMRVMADRVNSPFDSLSRCTRNLEDFFDGGLAGGCVPAAAMRVNIHEDGDHLVLSAEVPGLKREDIDITMDKGVLTIAAGHENETEKKEEGYVLRERWSGKVSRSFRLPETVDAEKAEANLTDGVLTLRFPTREDAKPRQIPVK